jgi:hypothetical protein
MDPEADYVWVWLVPATAPQDPSDAATDSAHQDTTWELVLRRLLQLEGHTSGLVFWFGGPYLWRDSTTNSVYYLLEAAENQTARGVEEFDQRCMRLGQAARRHLDCHGFRYYSVRIVVVPDTLFGARWLNRLMP